MQFHAQYGEDRLLWDYFGKVPRGVCVEVGGYDGVTGSNSLFFEKQGWTTIVVEPMPAYAEIIRKARPAARLFNCAAGAKAGKATFTIAHGAEAYSTMSDDVTRLDRIQRGGAKVEQLVVPVRTVDSILEEAGVGELQFATIDVEGVEEVVLSGFDLDKWRPRVLILENKFGKYSPRFRRLLFARGYHFFQRTGCNEWYLHGSEPAVTPGLRAQNRVVTLAFGVIDRVKKPFEHLLRESGLKAWNYRRISARRKRKRRKPKAG